jgi:Uma2 family endonuclease
MNIRFLPPVRTIGDLLHRLGDVPAERVRFDPVPGAATVQHLSLPENRLCELLDDTLVEKAVGYRESLVAMVLAQVLGAFVRGRNLGLLSGPDGPFEILPGLVRLPDLAFISWDRLPGRSIPESPVPGVVPDLVIEVWSQNNSRAEIVRKREEYFRSGVRVVWEIDPRARTVQVFTSLDRVVQLSSNDTLSGEPLLPGFLLPLQELFAELDRQGQVLSQA